MTGAHACPIADVPEELPPEDGRDHLSQHRHTRADWTATIHSSQFRSDCSRMLLFEDDLKGQGLGYSANYYASLLILAIKNDRVLAEVPVDASWPRDQPPYSNGTSVYTSPSIAFHPSGLKPATSPRWCDRPPFTLQCYYREWTRCSIPASQLHVAPVPHYKKRFLPWYRLVRLGYAQERILRVK